MARARVRKTNVPPTRRSEESTRQISQRMRLSYRPVHLLHIKDKQIVKARKQYKTTLHTAQNMTQKGKTNRSKTTTGMTSQDTLAQPLTTSFKSRPLQAPSKTCTRSPTLNGCAIGVAGGWRVSLFHSYVNEKDIKTRTITTKIQKV